MLHGQPAADLEQGLAVTLGQLVQDDAPGSVAERFEQIGSLTHRTFIGKSPLACQGATNRQASMRANSSGSMTGIPSWAAFLALLVVVSEVTSAVVFADTLLLAEPPRASIRSLTVVRV